VLDFPFSVPAENRLQPRFPSPWRQRSSPSHPRSARLPAIGVDTGGVLVHNGGALW